MWNPFKTNQRLKDLQSEVDCLRDLLQKHSTTMAHELFKLKNPWYERSQSTVGQPLTEEQEKIVREFNENSKLPEQIRRGFASGGHIGMRAALGRFGEAPSEQTRASDQYPSPTPGDVNIEVLIREEQRMMDREAWDQLDLDDIGKPKE